MTDGLFTPYSHPSTWQQEVEQLRAHNGELALQVLASDGQAAEAHTAQLKAQEETRWQMIRAQQAIDEAKALRARVATLEAALREVIDMTDEIAKAPMTADRWADRIEDLARAALQQEAKP